MVADDSHDQWDMEATWKGFPPWEDPAQHSGQQVPESRWDTAHSSPWHLIESRKFTNCGKELKSEGGTRTHQSHEGCQFSVLRETK